MVSDKTKRYILHPAVYYRKYEHSIVLYLTSQQKVFTFGGSADVILNSFKSYSSIADVASSISAQMDPAHSDNVFEIVSEFSEELIRLGILKEEYQQYDNENNLEKEIESQFSDGKQLYTVTIELTYRCNEQCRHCYVVQKNLPELTTKQIKAVIQSLRDMNVMNLVFTGGELFVRPDT